MNRLVEKYASGDEFIAIAVTLGLVFIVSTGVILVSIIVRKIRKRSKERLKANYWEEVKDSLSMLTIFADNQEEGKQVFREQCERMMGIMKHSPALKQWILDEIIIQQSNLSGASKDTLVRSYVALGLQALSRHKLTSRHWSIVVQGIKELEAMDQRDCEVLIRPFLSSRRQDIRIAARLAISRLATDPLDFFDTVNEEISEWERMEIDLRLRGRSKSELPDFSRYYQHEQPSIIWFCVEMSVRFNYFEHIPHLMEALKASSGELAVHIIHSLSKLEAFQAIDLIKTFVHPEQCEDVLRSAIYFLGEIGDTSCDKELSICLDHSSASVRMEAVSSSIKLELPIHDPDPIIQKMIAHHQCDLI